MSHIAVFGAVKIPRKFCPLCKEEAFIIKGEFDCCNLKDNGKIPKKYQIIAGGIKKRFQPKQKNKKIILEAQNNLCIYCRKTFDRYVWSKKYCKYIKLSINWDHFVPYAFNNFCKDDNFVAACSACNRIKSSKIFKTIEEASDHIKRRFSQKYSEKEPKSL